MNIFERKIIEEVENDMAGFDVSISDFGRMRMDDKCYVDKTLFIQEFLQRNEAITLITRPRRFGKTTLMTMVADFFDIERNSADRFNGLQIMNTKYAALINSRPVIFLSFRDCDADTEEELRISLNTTMFYALEKAEKELASKLDMKERNTQNFLELLEKLQKNTASFVELKGSLGMLIRIYYQYYQKTPLVLIDEYDQPLLASYTHGYYAKTGTSLAAFYTSALKDNPLVFKALMTGIQRVAKESIFSKFNNPAIYTVANDGYKTCCGFTEEETAMVLKEAGLELDEETREMYDGYRFGGVRIYNPASIIGYAQNKERRSFWVNTSSNRLIHESIASLKKNEVFLRKYEKLLKDGYVEVSVLLETSYMELEKPSAFWGLLLNAGYLTIEEKSSADQYAPLTVRIPNKEVRQEFISMVSEDLELESGTLNQLFGYLDQRKMDRFLDLYQEIILTSTSYYDGKKNAYHMFFLGMCISLYGKYKVTSNLEAGYGRHDIMLEPLKAGRSPIIIEFKQANVSEKADVKELAQAALKQIQDKKYYASMHGDILLIGIGHQGKRCEMLYETIQN